MSEKIPRYRAEDRLSDDVVCMSCDVTQLEADLEEHDAYYRKVIDEKCASDEVHCTCVPALRDKINQLEAENEALRLKAKHTVESVNTIRGVMRINREHKDLFGGAVYLVDHTHMWALVRNAEDLDALLTGVDDAS